MDKCAHCGNDLARKECRSKGHNIVIVHCPVCIPRIDLDERFDDEAGIIRFVGYAVPEPPDSAAKEN